MQLRSFELGDLLTLALVIQGFILAGLLFYSAKTIVSNRWLGTLVFIVSEATLMMLLDHAGIWGRYPILNLVMVHFILAVGPIVYFYTQSLLFSRNRLSPAAWLNFLPLLLGMKHQLIYLFYISGTLNIPFAQDIYFRATTQRLLFEGFPIVPMAGILSFTIYALITYRIISRYEKGSALSSYKLKDVRWIKRLLHFAFAFIAIWIFSFVNNVLSLWDLPKIWDRYLLYLPAVSLVYLLGMGAWRRQNNMPATELAAYVQRPTKSYFAADEATDLTLRLNELMRTERVYLNPLLKVEDVATRLAIPEKTLSSLLNQHIGKNFNDLVNEYRVAEAKQRLIDPANSNFTIAAVAFDCGFNSLPTFQRAFKQHTGTTPSRYQNDNFLSGLVAK